MAADRMRMPGSGPEPVRSLLPHLEGAVIPALSFCKRRVRRGPMLASRPDAEGAGAPRGWLLLAAAGALGGGLGALLAGSSERAAHVDRARRAGRRGACRPARWRACRGRCSRVRRSSRSASRRLRLPGAGSRCSGRSSRDRSWAYLNRGLVYVALAVGRALWPTCRGRCASGPTCWPCVVALPLGWALLGKAVPALGSSGRIARLSSPIGYWNALALLFDFGLPLALWLASRREHPHWLRAAGTCLLYGLVVGVLLTYSRGGVLAAGAAVVLVAGCSARRGLESGAALLLGGGAGRGGRRLGVHAAGLASRPAAALGAGARRRLVRARVRARALAWCGAVAYLGSLAEERRPLTERGARWSGAVGAGRAGAGVAVAVVALVADSKPPGWFRDFTQQPTDAALRAGRSTWPTRARRAAGSGGRRRGRRSRTSRCAAPARRPSS